MPVGVEMMPLAP